jgi:RNA polymerase sigma factor (sigma-70 family)
MASALPVVLGRLLDSSDPAAREAGWEEFITTHTRLLLHVARSLGGDQDVVMDRYTYLLEQLRRDDFRRLRSYAATGRSEFSTWLVVVAQRIYLDHHRQRYGRFRPRDGEEAVQDEERAARRRLVDLLSAEIDLGSIADKVGLDAEGALRSAELQRHLLLALGRLAPADRLLIKLRFEDDLPMPEIARTLAFPTRFHAYRRLTQALAELRLALQGSGVRDATP